MRVDRGPRGGGVLLVGQVDAQLRPGPLILPALLVEYLRDRSPARPPGQDLLLRYGCWPLLTLNVPQRAQGGQIRPDPLRGTGWGEIGLALRAEP